MLVASHSLSELPLETFRMYLAALSGRCAYVLYCTQVEWPTVEESSLKRSLLEARYSNHRRQLIDCNSPLVVDWWLSECGRGDILLDWDWGAGNFLWIY